MWSTGIKHHQKINRIARRKLSKLRTISDFPSVELLEHFEGHNGPDGLTIKSPGHNETDHYYDPFDDEDVAILEDIDNHFNHLVKELNTANEERKAFEASWLSHTLVDGLTPAHHTYQNEIAEVGEKEKGVGGLIVIKGEKPRQTLKNTWKVYGNKGVLTKHILFEGGVAAISAPLKFNDFEVSENDIEEATKMGLDGYFMMMAREIAMMRLYDEFLRTGWTTNLARMARDELMPRIIKVVVAAWYLALEEADKT